MSDRALIISDTPDLTNRIRVALSNAGFDVIASEDSFEAVKMVYELLPDIVVMEDRLSATDLFDLCYHICSLSHIPVIMLGEEYGETALVAGLQRGADFYMRSPISTPELVARVRSLLRRGNGRLDGVRRFLNTEEHSALVANQWVRLSPTEFRLLAYMVLNRGRVIPTEEFMCQVWPGEHVTDGSLSFYVSRLRLKLDHSSPHNIFTHRGVGYRLGWYADEPYEDNQDTRVPRQGAVVEE